MIWFEAKPERLAVETELLKRYHSPVRLEINKKTGIIRLYKRVRTPSQTYEVEGRFAKNHPYSAMKFKIIRPRIKSSAPHAFSSGVLCLHADKDVGPQTSAKVYLDWAKQWIQVYENWLATGDWPRTNKDD